MSSGKCRLETSSQPQVGRHCLARNCLHPAVFIGIIDLAREGGAIVIQAGGSIGDEVLAPAVDIVAPGVGEAVGDEDVKLLRPRLVSEEARLFETPWTIRSLDLGVVEGSFLPVEGPARIPGEGVHGVVRVGGVKAVDDDLADIGLVVAVGVLEEHHVRLLGDIDAAVSQLDTRGNVQAVGENDLLVGLAVAIGILKDQHLSFTGGPGDTSDRWHGGDPEPALGVEGHLHGLLRGREIPPPMRTG